MSHINRYPYDAQHNPLLFDPPSRPEKTIKDIKGIKNTKSLNSDNTNNSANNSNSEYSTYSYRKVARGTAQPHLQPFEKTTTVYRRSNNRTMTSIVTVNSQDRVQVPRTLINSYQQLTTDPLIFTSGSTNVVVYMQNHGLQSDDYVSVSGVSTPITIVNQPFETRTGSNFVRIEIVASDSLTDSLRSLDNLFVQIANVTSNVGSIPANLINGLQKVYLTCNYSNYPSGITGNTDTVSLNTNDRYIYINIPREATSYYSDRSSPSNTPTNMGVTLQFQFIAGVPLYYINTGYPTSLVTYDPYLQVNSIINSDTFTIRLRQEALQTTRGGGSWIQIASLGMANPGYLQPSNYSIDLPQEYTNVLKVELVGCAIPFSGYMVISADSGKNNSVYWQLLDDASATIYSASITRGNYDESSLATALQKAMNEIIRVDTHMAHDFTVTINEDTDQVAFILQDSRKLKKSMMVEFIPGNADDTVPHVTYLYVIDANTRVTVGDEVTISNINAFSPLPAYALQGSFTVTTTTVFADMDAIAKSSLTSQAVQQSLADRKNALINALTTLGYTIISSNITLGSGVVYPMVSSFPDFYQMIIVDPYDATDNTLTSYSLIAPVNQVSTTVSSPSSFRMQFTELDTLGLILGFREPGSANSITNYKTTVYNTDLYDFELKLGVNPSVAMATSLNLKGDGYIYLCCPQLDNMQSTAPSIGSNASSNGSAGGVSNIFAKIHLDGHRGKILYNTQVYAPKIFDTPLTSLSYLDILIVCPDGREYDFNGRDHSLTFQITQVHSAPEDVAFNTNTGQLLEELPQY